MTDNPYRNLLEYAGGAAVMGGAMVAYKYWTDDDIASLTDLAQYIESLSDVALERAFAPFNHQNNPFNDWVSFDDRFETFVRLPNAEDIEDVEVMVEDLTNSVIVTTQNARQRLPIPEQSLKVSDFEYSVGSNYVIIRATRSSENGEGEENEDIPT